eukprot:900906-Amphidinium_carterae.1
MAFTYASLVMPRYYGCFERPYFYCRSEDCCMEKDEPRAVGDATNGRCERPQINGKLAYQAGDEVIPAPPRSIPCASGEVVH